MRRTLLFAGTMLALAAPAFAQDAATPPAAAEARIDAGSSYSGASNDAAADARTEGGSS